MAFNYDKFEKDLFEAVEKYAKTQLDKKGDLYIMSIEYFPEYTTFIAIRANTYSHLEERAKEDERNYTYYKYCEEEWGLCKELEHISNTLQAEYDETCDDEEFDELQEEHTAKIIDVCKAVMKKFKGTAVYREFPGLFLNVYVREYFNKEETVQTFLELNGEDSISEYSDWL